MNIVLDTNIILLYPEILSKEDDRFKFHIPIYVIEELRRHKSEILNILNQIKNNSIVFQKTEISDVGLMLTANLARISYGDTKILEYAISLKKQTQELKFATQDIPLARAAKDFEIDTISLNELKELLEKEDVLSKNIELNQKVKSFIKRDIRNVVISFFLGVLVSVLASIIYANLEKIIGTINIWGTIVATLILGIGLFIFREKQRLAYGIAEFFAGIAAVILIFYPSFDYSSFNFDLSLGLKLFGALYIMVRGQDNIIKALEGRRLGQIIRNKLKK